MPEASSDNRQPIPGLIYWAASLVSDKKPDNASSATSIALDQQIPCPVNGLSSVSEPTGDDEDPLNYDILSYPGIMAKKLAGKTVMEQFVHPAYWIRALDKQHPGIEFTVKQYGRAWIHCVGKVKGRVDKGGLTDEEFEVAFKEVLDLVYKKRLMTRAERGVAHQASAEKRIKRALESGDQQGAIKFTQRMVKRAKWSRADPCASLEGNQAKSLMLGEALFGTEANTIPLGYSRVRNVAADQLPGGFGASRIGSSYDGQDMKQDQDELPEGKDEHEKYYL